MIKNTEYLKDYMLEFCNFNAEYFIRVLISGRNENLTFSKETFIQFLLACGKIKNPDEELTESILDNWTSSYFLESYIKSTDLPDKDLNKILLDLFVLPKLNYMTFTQEGSKKLMRAAEITNEFYYEHVDRLGKYYNILKKNNPNLKDDGTKLLTIINKEPSSLERDIENKFNLSSKEIFNLPPRYFITHYYHFNWDAIHYKYRDLMCEKIKDFFNNETEMLEALKIGVNNYNISSFLWKVNDFNVFENNKVYEEKVIQFMTLNLNNITTMDKFLKEILSIHDGLPYSIRKSFHLIKTLQERISAIFGFDFDYKWIETVMFEAGAYGIVRDNVCKLIKEFEDASKNGENIDVSSDLFKRCSLKN